MEAAFLDIQEKCYEWEKNWGEKPTGEQNSSQKTDDETAKKTAITGLCHGDSGKRRTAESTF